MNYINAPQRNRDGSDYSRRLEPTELDDLRSRLLERTEEVALACLGEPRIRTRTEWRWGNNNGSLALALRGAKRGLWRDRATDEGGDLLGMLRQAHGSFPAALDRALAITGYEPVSRYADLTPEQRLQRAVMLVQDRERLAEEQAKRRAAVEAVSLAEDAKAIATAEGLWDARMPLTGTAGYVYLTETRGIPEPAGGFGDDVAWHPSQRALMLAARALSGRVTAVQLVRVTPDGKKRVRSGALVKKTVGRLHTNEGASGLRLAHRANANPSVLLHAEGGETGLTVWAVTGLATWVGFGSRFDVQHDVLNVICADDDAPDSKRAQALRAELKEWADTGIRYAVATPWTKPRGNGCDFNDVIREVGEHAVRARLACVLPKPTGPKGSGLPAYYPAAEASLEAALDKQEAEIGAHWAMAQRVSAARRDLSRQRADAIAQAGGEDAISPTMKTRITRKLHRAIADAHGFGKRIPLPPQAMFSGAQGSGKTRKLRNLVLANFSPDVIWFMEPTTDKAGEEFDAYQASSLAHRKPAMLIRGRSRPDPDRPGHLMCDRAATAETVAKTGLSVMQHLCRDCPFSGACGDQRQRHEARNLAEGGSGAVFFAASEYVFLPAPIPMPDHAILDESLIIPAIKVVGLKLADLRALHVSNWSGATNDLNAVLQKVCDAVETPWSRTPVEVERLLSMGLQPRVEPMPLAYLRWAGVTLDVLKELGSVIGNEIEALLPDISGSMPDEQIVAAIEGAQVSTLRHAHSLVSTIISEFNRPRDLMNGLTYNKEDDVVWISGLRPLKGLRHASLTVLDGTGDIDLSRKLYGLRLEHFETRFPRQANVTGTTAKNYSRQSIIGRTAKGKAIGSREADAGMLRGDIAKVLGTLPTGSMVAGSKRVVESLQATGAITAGTLTATFAALRGINRWETSPAGLFVGAETISLRDLETKARAYLVNDDAPFISMDGAIEKTWNYKQWPFKVTRMRRMRDGTLEPVEVEVHPDPRVQAVHEQIREAELIQAVDRLRAVWNERKVILMNNLCLDIEYDRIYRHRDLVAGGDILERVYLETGILPLSPRDLHRLHPDRFRSVKAAEHVLGNYPAKANTRPNWKFGVVFRFRRIGQRGPEAKVVIDPARNPDAMTALQGALGPLRSVDGVRCKQAPVPAQERPATSTGPRVSLYQPQRPFWLDPIDLPPVPNWTPPPWMVPPYISRHSTGYGESNVPI